MSRSLKQACADHVGTSCCHSSREGRHCCLLAFNVSNPLVADLMHELHGGGVGGLPCVQHLFSELEAHLIVPCPLAGSNQSIEDMHAGGDLQLPHALAHLKGAVEVACQAARQGKEGGSGAGREATSPGKEQQVESRSACM